MLKHARIIRYIFSGGLATATNLFILFICVHYLDLWYLIGAAIAFCSAVVVSYLLQKFWTFKNYSTSQMHKEFMHFFSFALCMLGVNTLLMYLFVDKMGIWYMLAQALAAIISGTTNYLYFKKFVFKIA